MAGRSDEQPVYRGRMLFERRLREGLHDGSIRLGFRRWRRPQVVAATGTALKQPVRRLKELGLTVSLDVGHGSRRAARPTWPALSRVSEQHGDPDPAAGPPAGTARLALTGQIQPGSHIRTDQAPRGMTWADRIG
jgi:hypothetical protein